MPVTPGGCECRRDRCFPSARADLPCRHEQTTHLSRRRPLLGRHAAARPRRGPRLLPRVFGWQLDRLADYAVARLSGRDVAGSARRPTAPPRRLDHARTREGGRRGRARRADEAARRRGLEPLDAVARAGAWRRSRIPTGAVVCLWEARWREGAELVNEPGAWAMSTLADRATRRRPAPSTATVFGWDTEPFGAGDDCSGCPATSAASRSSPSRATWSP